MRAQDICSVSELTGRIKGLIEGEPSLARVYVRGEISNYKQHSSGHHYLTLKDEGAVINAVLFRSDAMKLKFQLASGMKIIARGRIGLFAKSGQYQLYMDGAIPDGVGELYVAFEQLKARLASQGLFDRERKKPIPVYPGRIALVTSPTGAAVRDMLRITGARFPLADILVCPVRVQGAGAPAEIAEMLRYVDTHRLADVMITGRGGGSIEDLWAFNDERVARAIAACETPVISAVGHEPDVTIADYVADLRAATPSNAAELATPDKTELIGLLREWNSRIYAGMDRTLSARMDRLKAIRGKRVLTSPTAYVDERRMELLYQSQKMAAAAERREAEARRKFIRAVALLDAMSPLKVLSRGYSIATAENGVAVTDAERLAPGDRISLRFFKGSADCQVIGTKMEE